MATTPSPITAIAALPEIQTKLTFWTYLQKWILPGMINMIEIILKPCSGSHGYD